MLNKKKLIPEFQDLHWNRCDHSPPPPPPSLPLCLFIFLSGKPFAPVERTAGCNVGVAHRTVSEWRKVRAWGWDAVCLCVRRWRQHRCCAQVTSSPCFQKTKTLLKNELVFYLSHDHVVVHFMRICWRSHAPAWHLSCLRNIFAFWVCREETVTTARDFPMPRSYPARSTRSGSPNGPGTCTLLDFICLYLWFWFVVVVVFVVTTVKHWLGWERVWVHFAFS